MITVVLEDGREIEPYDFKYPIYNTHGKIVGISTGYEENGNGTKQKAWCSFCVGHTWINNETSESVLITTELCDSEKSVLTEEGKQVFLDLINGVILGPETDMPDIF